MSGILRKSLVVMGWSLVLYVVVLAAVSAWIVAPWSPTRHDWGLTYGYLLRAHMAERVVIGDSRVAWTVPPEGAVFAGFPGGTTWDIERLAQVLCTFHRGPVTLAIGINDTQPRRLDLARSRSALARIASRCARRDFAIAEIWPPEPGVEPLGDAYDREAIAALNNELARVAAGSGATLLRAPKLSPGFTTDGVHFTKPVARQYASALTIRDSE